MVRRTKLEALATRNALLDAAESVFGRVGVAGASLQQVAAAAGVTRGAVYWHFRDKADLFNAMMDRATLPFEQQWFDGSPDDGADPLHSLRELLCDILRQVARDARLQRVLEISTQKIEYVGELGAIRERHLHRRKQALQRIEGLLRGAAAGGSCTVPPKAAACALHALVDGLISNWMLDRQAFDLCRVGRAAVQQMLAGMAAPAPPARGKGPAKHPAKRPVESPAKSPARGMAATV